MSLNKNNSIVEEALLQMKSIEEAISENAKGILASTMKEEISELVRESLNGSTKKSLYEQLEDDEDVESFEDEEDVEETEDGTEETEVDADVDVDGEEFDFSAMGTEEPMDNEDEMPPLDMTGSSPEEVLKVWKAMGDEDGIIIKKDGDNIHLTDTNTNNDYMISLGGESEDIDAMSMESTNEGVIYELVFEEDETNEVEMDEMWGGNDHDFKRRDGHKMGDVKGHYKDYEGDMDEEYMDEEEEVVYELEVQESMKPVGIGFGSMKSGFKKSSVNNKGFKEEMADGTKSQKTGKGPKFSFGKIKHGVTEAEMDEEYMDEEEYTEGWMDEDVDMMDDEKMEGDYMEGDESTYDEIPGETTEASRTLGNGSRNYPERKGLPKMKVRPTNEGITKEMNLLREKNEEYKKALDFFRNKLNEVAVFNSNLAYSTRLFTEHSTTKQEKINILRRFDNVESIKESKSLYKSIKNELDGSKGSNEVVTESIQRQVVKTPSNGSASNLIESKTYENPQFMRMRDLMLKIK
jgi:hypothetical protein